LLDSLSVSGVYRRAPPVLAAFLYAMKGAGRLNVDRPAPF
jgi:hypothetical protein